MAQAVDYQGLKQKAVAAVLGISEGHLSDIVRGKAKLVGDRARMFEARWGYRAEWLMRGVGPERVSEIVSATEQQPGPQSEAAGEPEGEYLTKAAALELLRNVGMPVALPASPRLIFTENREDLEQLEGQDAFVAIPFAADPIAAGAGFIREEAIAGYVVVHRSVVPNPDDQVAVRIQGHSMEPALVDGTIVGIDKSLRDPAQLVGKIVCARTEDHQVVIKRLRSADRRLMLESEDRDHPPTIIALRIVPEPVIGQVVWAWQDLR